MALSTGLTPSDDPTQIIEAKPELASVSGTWDSLAPLHRAAANGHVGVMQAVVEALRTFGSRIADPEKGDAKVLQTWDARICLPFRI